LSAQGEHAFAEAYALGFPMLLKFSFLLPIVFSMRKRIGKFIYANFENSFPGGADSLFPKSDFLSLAECGELY